MNRITCFGIVLITAVFTAPAMAYVGPGPGLTMLGSLVGLVGSLLAALFMILLWPMRLYYKKLKARQAQEKAPIDAPPAP